ncbi:MAG: bifunctional hydroxymethylpyrimidine kinase/phosphomethylpyrimidine kinase [Pseudomonadota bacterium]
MIHAARPSRTVAALSSLVMRGAVGLRASQFALERRGHIVWPVPTVLLPWHPGQGPSTRTLNPDFAAHTADLSTQAAALDAVFTGYFGASHQVSATAAFIDAVRKVQPSAIILVDPVIGDEHGRYVPDDVADAIKTELLPRADIITPNAFELFDLTGERDPDTAAVSTGVTTVVATSSAATHERIAATLRTGSTHHTVSHSASHPAPRGTGDLFAAVFLAATLEGQPASAALAESAAATSAVAAVSPGDALALQAAQSAIANAPIEQVATETA